MQMRAWVWVVMIGGCGAPIDVVTDEESLSSGQAVPCNHPGDAMTTARGVTAYCNDLAESGEYQCDQYANRFVSTLDLPPVDDWVDDLACEICDHVANDPTLSKLYSAWGPGYRNPAGHKPGPGDLLIFWEPAHGCVHGNSSAPGHVAVETGADATHLYYAQQNWMLNQSIGGSAYAGLPLSSVSWYPSTSFFGHAGGPGGAAFAPRCWIHPECPKGTSCNPGPNHNPCRAVAHADNGDYCGTETQAGFDALSADPSVVYECFDGQIAREQHCPNGCSDAPPGTPDRCN
jgi:hypothetical protein